MRKLRPQRGQVLLLFAMILPVIILFVGLYFITSTLYQEQSTLSSADEAAALAAAQQICITPYLSPTAECPVAASYDTSGSVDIPALLSSAQPLSPATTNPCLALDPDSVVLCAVYTTLQADYPTATITNAQGNPTSLNTLNYWVYETNGSPTAGYQEVQVSVWYYFPNPFGQVLTSGLNLSSTQYAQPQTTTCIDGQLVC